MDKADKAAGWGGGGRGDTHESQEAHTQTLRGSRIRARGAGPASASQDVLAGVAAQGISALVHRSR